MVRESIDTIRQTEKDADKVEKDAATEKEQILQKAQEEADQIRKDAKIQAQKAEQTLLQSVKTESDQFLAQEKENALHKAALLHKSAQSRKEAAKQAVLSVIFE